MKQTSEKKPVPKFANIIFWVGAGVFIASIGSNILMGLIESLMKSLFLEEGQLVLENNALSFGQSVSGWIILGGLWIVGPTSLISLVFHPRLWIKGLSLLLLFYVVFMIWVMQPSGQHCCPP